MIYLGLQEHDGSLTSLGVGCWCSVAGRVYFRCPDCAGLYDVPREQVDSEGFASFGEHDGPFFFCQSTKPKCGFVRGVKFEGWQVRDIDTSDVGGGA